MTIEQFIVSMRQIGTELEFDATDYSVRSVKSGEPVIFLGFMRPYNGCTPARIGNINLVESIRRGGIGRTIVTHWEDLLRASGQTTSGITHVQEEGEGFWRKMGYYPIDDNSRNFMWIKSLA